MDDINNLNLNNIKGIYVMHALKLLFSGNKFNMFCTYISVLTRQPDIICLSESWLTVNDVNLHIPGYKFYNFPRPSHGGGIVMYIKCNIEIIVCNFNSSHHSFEVSWLQLHVHGYNCKISFILIFRPPSISKDDFLLELEQLMQTISHNLSDSIIARGDLNIDLSHNNQFSFNLINLFLYFNCFPTSYTPTQAIMKNASLLDHIFVNAPKFFILVL